MDINSNITTIHTYKSLFDKDLINKYISFKKGDLDDVELSNLVSLINKKQNYIQYHYNQKKTEDGECYGRRYTKLVGNGNYISPPKMKRESRAICFSTNYVDLDIVMAHPTILYIISIKYFKFKLGGLKRIIENRELIIEDLKEKLKVPRDKLKLLFTSLLYGGGIKKWFDDSDYPILDYEKQIKHIPQEIKDLPELIKKIRFKIVRLEEYKYMVDEAIKTYIEKDVNICCKNYEEFKKIKEGNKDAWKLQNKIFAWILQSYENHYLEIVVAHLKKRGFEIGSLIYDGCLVKKCKKDLEETIKECKKKLNAGNISRIKFDLKIKEMQIPDMSEIDNRIVLPDNKGVINFLGDYYKDRVKRINDDEYYFQRITNDTWKKGGKGNELVPIIESQTEKINIWIEVVNEQSGKKQVRELANQLDLNAKICGKFVQGITSAAFDGYLKYPILDANFKHHLIASSRGYLPFSNCLVRMSDKKMIDYKSLEFKELKIFLPFRLAKRYNPNINEKFKDIIKHKNYYGIFETKEEAKCFLELTARSLGGHATDKFWTLCLSDRNSGKSTEAKYKKNIFPEYFGYIPNNYFVKKGNPSDTQDNWKYDNIYRRFYLVEEFMSGDCKTIVSLDDGKIKKESDGGQGGAGRKLYSNNENVPTQNYTFQINTNKMPMVDNNDIFQNCFQFDMCFYFLAADEYEKRKTIMKNQGQLEENHLGKNKYGVFLDDIDHDKKYKIIEEDQSPQNEEYQDAWIDLILDNYKTTRLIVPDIIRNRRDLASDEGDNNAYSVLLNNMGYTICKRDQEFKDWKKEQVKNKRPHLNMVMIKEGYAVPQSDLKPILNNVKKPVEPKYKYNGNDNDDNDDDDDIPGLGLPNMNLHNLMVKLAKLGIIPKTALINNDADGEKINTKHYDDMIKLGKSQKYLIGITRNHKKNYIEDL